MKLYTKAEILKEIDSFLNKESVQKKIIEILGPTGSGKTGFALDLTQRFKKAEILSVDSRQVYREIDIASAKISTEKQQGIPHHGLNLIDPNQEMSVYEFQQYGFRIIDEILSRGNLPILCGGTMLWLDAISENYQFDASPRVKSDRKGPSRYEVLKIGIHWTREKLYERINARAKKQFDAGLIEETQKILSQYTLSRSAMTSFGYQEIQHFLKGEIFREEALDLNQKRNRNYAKRQLTWWRGRKDVLWVDGEIVNSERQ
ncbi:hypothetical protein K9M59_04295 [Candidatus Gracilibacteria bacterium]|nr:hypothetical protein [Candidatus Gracilibacteria bacterium]MCF7819541.1 hypothetical protein [Candidatus Gracilibacteria bacterium]